MLPTLCQELDALAKELEVTPREHESVLILGEMAAYLSSWHKPMRLVVRRFAAMTGRMAAELEEEIKAQAGDNKAVQQLQARQCQLRMVSLLYMGPGGLDDKADSALVVERMVQVKHGRVFNEHATAEQEKQLRQLHVRCHNVTARHAMTLVQHAISNSDILTKAIRCVLQRTPSSLVWQRIGDSGSFESIGVDGHLYSMNILDGAVLLDGSPPGRLTKSILGHPLYLRTFGKRDFEVARTKSGVLQTLKPVCGRFYDFAVEAPSRLNIIEIDKQRALELELLDVAADESCSGWGYQLPVPLRKLHSHWYSRSHQKIVLRPRFFQHHNCDFIIKVLT